MKQKPTIGGHSYVLNLLFVILNILGLVLLVWGNHDSQYESGAWMRWLGISLVVLTSAGIIILKGRLMMSSVARVIVGSLLIVSGLVKANDPMGFAYKLEEYFEDGALAYRIKELFGAPEFSLEGWMSWALSLSILICLLEIVFGVMLLIGGKIKTASYVLLPLMLFFTFLTWHTASCDPDAEFLDRDVYASNDPIALSLVDQAEDNDKIKVVKNNKREIIIEQMKTPQCVTDCGCFGDAMKGSVGRSLTPNESLWKDIVLLYLVLWIFISQWIIEANNRRQNILFGSFGLLFVSFFAWVFGWYFSIFFALAVIVAALWIKRAGGIVFGNHSGSLIGVLTISLSLIIFVLMYSPLKDYRPYAVGSDLNAKMNDGVPGKYESTIVYKNKRTGEKKEYLANSSEFMDSKIWEDEDWEFLKMSQRTIVPEKLPSIMDFNPCVRLDDFGPEEASLDFITIPKSESGDTIIKIWSKQEEVLLDVSWNEYTDDIEGYPTQFFEVRDTVIKMTEIEDDICIADELLALDEVVIMTAKSLDEASWNSMSEIKSILKACKKKRVPMILICNASRTEINAFRKKHSLKIPCFSMDEIELKIIARSDPSILVLNKGKVKAKLPHRSFTDGSRFVKEYLKK